MPLQRLFSVFFLPLLWAFLTTAEDATQQPSVVTTVHVKSTVSGSSVSPNSTNSTVSNHGKKRLSDWVDSAMIERALYVLIGITVIGVLYFLVRAVRLKKPVQRKKYGLLSNYEDGVEMDGMESDEDETVYEARSLRR